MPFPKADKPLTKQFKVRCNDEHLAALERYKRDGVTLPGITIPPGTDKSKLVRLALGLDDPPDTTPGVNALDELTRRVNRRGD